jgi:hypothetical protein
LLLEGRWKEANDVARAIHTGNYEEGLTSTARNILGPLARLQGDSDRAWTLIRETLPDGPRAAPGTHRFLDVVLIQRLSVTLALIAAHRLLGELNTDTGRFDGAAIYLNASLALADACAAPYERALTLLALAERHAAVDDTDATRTLLDEVRAICEPLGAKPTLARVEALIARL